MTDQRNGGISWADETWNPFRGCSRVSEGCRHCYAEGQAARYSGTEKSGKEQAYKGLVVVGEKGPRWTGIVRFVPTKLSEPLRWSRHRRIFTNSMSDMFHETIPREQIASVLGVMALASNHTFITLTKRPERMRELLNSITEEEAAYALASPSLALHVPVLGAARGKRISAQMREMGRDPACPNPSGLASMFPWMQWGVSVEDQDTANDRIPHLLQTHAMVRIVSYEPALGPVDFRMLNDGSWYDREGAQCYDALTGHAYYRDGRHGLGGGPALDQVIVGGESGLGARPFDVAWAEHIVEQCSDTSCVPFVKQLGSNPILSPGPLTYPSSHPKGADMAEWPAHLRVQRFPAEPR